MTTLAYLLIPAAVGMALAVLVIVCWTLGGPEPAARPLPATPAGDPVRALEPWPAAALRPHASAERHLIRRRVICLYWEADQPARDALARAGWPAYT